MSMESLQPKKREGTEGKESAEGIGHTTMIAGAMFLAAMGADPALAQERGQGTADQPRPQETVRPQDILNGFIRGMAADLQSKGIDRRLIGAAADVLRSISEKGAADPDAIRKSVQEGHLEERAKAAGHEVLDVLLANGAEALRRAGEQVEGMRQDVR